jgi:ubiquinone/menaquinone biosynthesis C-methylase UbiE
MLEAARQRLLEADLQQGRGEQIDYPAESLDLVFSVDVIHHVADCPAYFREVFCVLKKGGRLCTVTDSEEIIRRRQPLAVYFPETVEIELKRYPAIADLRGMMAEAGFGGLQEELAEFPYSLTDNQTYREKAFSCLHLISEEAFERGIARMDDDLGKGPIPCVSRYLLLWGRKG